MTDSDVSVSPKSENFSVFSEMMREVVLDDDPVFVTLTKMPSFADLLKQKVPIYFIFGNVWSKVVANCEYPM